MRNVFWFIYEGTRSAYRFSIRLKPYLTTVYNTIHALLRDTTFKLCPSPLALIQVVDLSHTPVYPLQKPWKVFRRLLRLWLFFIIILPRVASDFCCDLVIVGEFSAFHR